MKELISVSAEMDGVKIVEENDDFLVVPVTIAREGIFEFQKPTGKKQGYRPATELKNSAFTAEGAWVVAKKHINTVFVMDPSDIRGRLEKTRWCDDIHGVIGQIRWYKKLCEKGFINEVKTGTRKDVSIGYFCDEDLKPGEWSGQKYDFVQRNIMIGHLAAGLPVGRCPSPWCGMQVDSAIQAMFDPEETENYIRIPVSEGEVVATITLSEGEGIKAQIGRKDGKSFIITYLFQKDKGWTMEKAQAWVDKHKEDSVDADPEGDSAIKAKILELGQVRKGIMDKLYPQIDENTPERTKQHLEVSIIDEQINKFTKKIAHGDAVPKVDAATELQRSKELMSPYHLNDIGKKKFHSKASN